MFDAYLELSHRRTRVIPRYGASLQSTALALVSDRIEDLHELIHLEHCGSALIVSA
jgi:hypothetical protein